MKHFFSKYILSSLARQLIFGIAAVHAILMTIFVFDLVERQRDFMLTQSTEQAIGLASTLAANGASWILANDLVGIEEIISSQKSYPGLRYAMFIDKQGKLLGYTERDKVGLYIDDQISKIVFSGNTEIKVLLESQELVDVVAPIKVNNTLIGWARVGISRSLMTKNLELVTLKGFIYILIAVAVGILFAWLMASSLTKGIRELRDVIDKFIAGSRDVSSELNRHDELEDLSYDFNKMLSTIKDNEIEITKSHEALILSERKVSKLIDNLRTAYVFYSHDTNGVFTYLSPSLTDVLGYTLDEYMHKYDQFYTDNVINIQGRKNTANVIKGKPVSPYEVEVFHKDGSKIIMEVTESALKDSKGNVIAVEGLARDITKIKEAANNLQKERDKLEREQLLLESIINAIPDQIYYKKIDGSYLGSNNAFNASIGLTKSQMINKNDSDLFPVSRADNNKAIEKYIKETNQVIHNEEVFTNKTGKKQILDTIYTAFNDLDGDLLGYIQISRDVTEIRSQQAQLRKSQKMDALGKLTGGIAHDYNNLLGVIIGYAELLSLSTEDKKLEVYANEIMKAGNRGSKLTKKLLAFTKIQSSTASSININEVLNSDLNMIQKTLTARISVDFKLDVSLWNTWIDIGDFQDALLNMSINAMHAMPDGGVFTVKTQNISISTLEAETSNNNLSAGEYVKMSLIDTGCGMDEYIKEQLFDPFFTTKGEQGTGLGLSQVFGFIKRSDAYIEVDSEVGKGTTFKLYFKRYNDGNDDVLEEKHGTETISGKGQGILVVDDEPALKALAAEILSKQGFKIYQASSASVALEILEKEDISLVLSDVIMPEMDGYELSSIIMAKYPEVKIIFASGFTTQKPIKPEHQSLIDNLLHKPYSSSELTEAVSNILK